MNTTRFVSSGPVWSVRAARVFAALSLLVLASTAAPAGSQDNPPLPPTERLIAHWEFNEPDAAVVFQDSAPAAACPATAKEAVARRRGIYGRALDLQGGHAIQAAGFGKPEMQAITLSAWVKPSDLSGYREIFRQECDNRVLFSFQESGSVLSLGLNVNGYVECDGRIEPKRVQNGLWHFCAATFDGKFMRVYLDAREVAALELAGKIALCPEAPAFIGSSNGVNEHFQGGLDDLRVYDRALTPAALMALYKDGLAVIAEASKQLNDKVNSLYTPGATLAEAVVNTRSALSLLSTLPDADLVEGCLSRIRSAFPEEYDRLMDWTGGEAESFLTNADGSFLSAQVARLIALMMEYKPLTDYQQQHQSPESAKQWADADAIQQRFDALQAQGENAKYSPEWINLILEAGSHIAFRPHVNEPVAPYVKPETPVTRDLTTEEARDALEQDWLHQADGDPAPQRIRDEIAWARDLAQYIHADVTAELARLDELQRAASGLAAPDRDLYFEVRAVKRAIMFKNPALDFSRVLFVDMPYPAGSEWPHETRHRLGYMAVPGARLLVLDGLNPGGKLMQLMPQAPLHGSFWRPDVSFDGKKVLFCFKPHNEKSFHLYEINIDGTGLTQLTDGIYDDLDPIYLPDGHIMFPTTRGHNYVRCMPPTNSFEMARADGDGKNVYIISYSNEPDYLPSVMEDGRVVYTRWEYTDKPLWRAQKLWTTHPDGTQVVTYWGNQSVWPDVMKDARNIPGSRRVMFTGSAHHNWFAGSVGIIDPDKGLNFPKGLTKVTADVEWPECGNGPVDPAESSKYHAEGAYPAYYSPYPLSERDFLVSAQRGDGKFRLYLMDVDGNRELVYEGLNNVFHAMPVKARPMPPVLADRVDWPTAENKDHPKPGVIYSNNVYQNAPAELRGKARYLRILQIDSKTYTYWYKRPYISTGPVVSAVQSEGVKRILGTVPIAEDGSVSFEAPPGQALHFQLLDENQRALQTMRSFVGVMPGESRGCLGCHESHSRTPRIDDGYNLALKRPPRAITPPPWPDNTVSYARYVRPVLDKYCAKCHEGGGKGRKTFDMTERFAAPCFSEPYLTLIGRPSWGAPYTPPEKPEPGFGIADVLMVEAYGQLDPKAYVTPPPMTSLSFKSRLVEMASSGKHNKVKVDEESLLRLITWVDAMCPYLGDEEVRAIPDPEFQGVDWLAIRPRIQTAPVIIRPGPVD